MTTAWIKIPKPTGRPWVKIPGNGKQLFDDETVLFDDMMVFFDGGDGISWVKVPKPIS